MKLTSTGGFDGLKKAGEATLKDDGEIREVVSLIIDHGKLTPIGINGELDGKDLKVFFDYAAKENTHFLRVPLEDVIQDSGAKSLESTR